MRTSSSSRCGPALGVSMAPDRSRAGHSSAAPAGIGSPSALRLSRTARARAAPEESPASTTSDAPPPGSVGRDQDRGQVGQPLVQVADVEQVAKVGKLLIEDPD